MRRLLQATVPLLALAGDVVAVTAQEPLYDWDDATSCPDYASYSQFSQYVMSSGWL